MAKPHSHFPNSRTRSPLDDLLDWSTGVVFGVVILLLGYFGGWRLSSVMSVDPAQSAGQLASDDHPVDTPEWELLPVSGLGVVPE